MFQRSVLLGFVVELHIAGLCCRGVYCWLFVDGCIFGLCYSVLGYIIEVRVAGVFYRSVLLEFVIEVRMTGLSCLALL